MSNLNKAVFIDLDHTLITTKSGRVFPIHSEDWKFLPDSLRALDYFYKAGYKIIIVSNQGGIEEGYITEKLFIAKIEKVCSTLEKLLKFKKNYIIYYYCSTMTDYNRKPNPGMAFEAALDYELDLIQSIMIGDMDSDKGFAVNAGINTYYDINDLPAIIWN